MKRTVFLAALALVLSVPGQAQQRNDFTYSPNDPGYAFDKAQPAPETTRGNVPSLGRRAGDNYCIPPQWTDSRGVMNLIEPGGNPSTCVFKSDVQTRQCDCSTYYYRNVHSVGMANDGTTSTFSPNNFEEAANGSQCISYSYRPVTSCYCYDGSCYCSTSNEAYCPGSAT